MRRLFLLIGLLVSSNLLFGGYPKEQQHYWRTVRPIMDLYCSRPCHNADDNKAGLNLNKYDFIRRIQSDGQVFRSIIEHIEAGTMPPEGKPKLSQTEQDTFLFYINKYLAEALNKPDPGIIPSRRLSNREYHYAILDLTDVSVNTDSIFPRDPSGGEGFDNYARILYITPILMERYFEVAEYVIEEMTCNTEKWRTWVPEYNLTRKEKWTQWWSRWWHKKDISQNLLMQKAKDAIVPFAMMAYRRYLNPSEVQNYLDFFSTVYATSSKDANGFDQSIGEVFKALLVSPHFLIRQEGDPSIKTPYLVSNFELATRLSFFLWSSIPDKELLEVAYRGNLQDPKVIKQQVRRLLQDPKSRRFAESFATQWLDVDDLLDPTHEIDQKLFPEYDEALKEAMYQEAVHYFYYSLTESRNLLELLDAEFTFMNERLAKHYKIGGIKGKAMRKVALDKSKRGGILGMAGVLTATSLPNRTSPVLRGKWVLEKILATKAKPPPPNVPELEASKNVHDEMTLRELLVVHRDKPACRGCHEEMDDLGFALENFDAIGRWRESYKPDAPAINVSGTLKTGESFEGIDQLKPILLNKKEKFAKGISKKMLGYALGRSIVFQDEKTVEALSTALIENNFDPYPMIEILASSYPFRYKKSDPVKVDTVFGD